MNGYFFNKDGFDHGVIAGTSPTWLISTDRMKHCSHNREIMVEFYPRFKRTVATFVLIWSLENHYIHLILSEVGFLFWNNTKLRSFSLNNCNFWQEVFILDVDIPPRSLYWNDVCNLAAITGIIILVPCHTVKYLQRIWRSGPRRFHLRVPDLQMRCWDLTLKTVVLTMATRVTCPIIPRSWQWSWPPSSSKCRPCAIEVSVIPSWSSYMAADPHYLQTIAPGSAGGRFNVGFATNHWLPIRHSGAIGTETQCPLKRSGPRRCAPSFDTPS